MIKPIWCFFILAFILTFACNRNSSSKNQKSDQPTVLSPLPIFKTSFQPEDTLLLSTDTLLFYRRSACFGFCPTFDFTIFQNGIAKYEGFQHIEPIGTSYVLATDAWWNEVKMQLKKFDIYKLEPVYPIEKELYIPDLPNTIITIKEYGLRKSVIDNHHAPKELKDFEFFIEAHFQKLFNHR